MLSGVGLKYHWEAHGGRRNCGRAVGAPDRGLLNDRQKAHVYKDTRQS